MVRRRKREPSKELVQPATRLLTGREEQHRTYKQKETKTSSVIYKLSLSFVQIF